MRNLIWIMLAAVVVVGLVLGVGTLRARHPVIPAQPEQSPGVAAEKQPKQLQSWEDLVEKAWSKLEPQQEQIRTEQGLHEALDQAIEELRNEGVLTKERFDKDSLIQQLIESLKQIGKLKGARQLTEKGAENPQSLSFCRASRVNYSTTYSLTRIFSEISIPLNTRAEAAVNAIK